MELYLQIFDNIWCSINQHILHFYCCDVYGELQVVLRS